MPLWPRVCGHHFPSSIDFLSFPHHHRILQRLEHRTHPRAQSPPSPPLQLVARRCILGFRCPQSTDTRTSHLRTGLLD